MGKSQRNLSFILLDAGTPLSFAEIRAVILNDLGYPLDPTLLAPSFVRSVRRSLASMVKRGELLSFGRPLRYYFHPLYVELHASETEKAAYYSVVAKNRDLNIAIRMDAAKLAAYMATAPAES